MYPQNIKHLPARSGKGKGLLSFPESGWFLWKRLRSCLRNWRRARRRSPGVPAATSTEAWGGYWSLVGRGLRLYSFVQWATRCWNWETLKQFSTASPRSLSPSVLPGVQGGWPGGMGSLTANVRSGTEKVSLPVKMPCSGQRRIARELQHPGTPASACFQRT